jgi:hypothetical protein
MIRNPAFALLLIALAALSGCTPPPPVTDSREVLWRQWGGQPVDQLLLTWGTPNAETRLTDGSRLLKYRRSTTYDAQSYHEYMTSCEVSFLAKPPEFRINDIAMEGTSGECNLLAKGLVADVVRPAAEPIYPYRYPYPHRRYPF